MPRRTPTSTATTMTAPTNPTPTTDPAAPTPASTAPADGKSTQSSEPATDGGEAGTESTRETSKGTINNVR